MCDKQFERICRIVVIALTGAVRVDNKLSSSVNSQAIWFFIRSYFVVYTLFRLHLWFIIGFFFFTRQRWIIRQSWDFWRVIFSGDWSKWLRLHGVYFDFNVRIHSQRANTLIKTFQWYRCELFFSSLYILDMPMPLTINLEWSAECFLLQTHFLGLDIHFWFNCHGICFMWFELLSKTHLISAWIQFFTLNYVILLCFFLCVEGEIEFPSKTKTFNRK